MPISASLLVERFYFEIWNRADETLARELLHPNFVFRGSLGRETQGPQGFIDYMRSIHAALANYTCVIDDLIATGDRAAARMTFSGLHRGRLFGVEATGREISWSGGAFFTTDANQIVELWVVGDIDRVKRQLNAPGQAALPSDQGTC